MARWDKWFGFSEDEIFEIGEEAMSRGDVESAIEAFERCRRDDHHSPSQMAANDQYLRLVPEAEIYRT